MAGVIRWRKASILSDVPDSDHVYIGVDSADGLLYLKNSAGDIFKYPTSDDVSDLVDDALSVATIPTAWGSITGTLSNQTDLQSALDAKLTIPTTSGFWSRFPSFPTVLNYFVKEIDIFPWVASSTLGDLTIVQSGTGSTTEHADITNVGAGINSTEKAIGVARTSLGTTSTGRAYFGFGIINGVNFALGNHAIKFGVRYTLDILADATDDYTVHIGHVGSYTSAPTTGVFFRYNYNVNGGRWEYCVGTGTITAADTGVAPTARAYQVLEIEVNTSGTQALFYIDGALVGTVTSGIPTATGLFPGVANFKLAGTTARLFFTDAIYLAVEKLSVR